METLTMKMNIVAAYMLSMAIPLPTLVQAAPAPGARPGDKEMTCDAVLAETNQITAAIQARANKKKASGKVGKAVGGFAKSVLGAALPSAIGNLGGNSVTGNIAAHAAGQSAGQLLNDAGNEASSSVQDETVKATEDEQARLDRLSRISAYRKCPPA